DFALARYNSDGSLDSSFGVNGKITTDLANASSDQGYGVSVQADGKILLVGTSNYNVALARYNAAGSLDTSFDLDGKVVTPTVSGAGDSVTVLADGKLLVAGLLGSGYGLVRYFGSGGIDASFGTNGVLQVDFGGYGTARSVRVQADGKILVAGASGDNFALARYNANGTLDTSFDGDGKLTTDFGSYDQGTNIALQADGKIVVAGTSNFQFAVARYNTDGSLDTSFDTDGKLTSSLGSGVSGQSVAVQADGKILVAGTLYGNGGYEFVVVRYNADGSVDKNFDDDGKAGVNIGTLNQTFGMLLQADGKILLTGTSNNDFLLARLNQDGSVDTTFAAPANTLDAVAAYTEPYFYYSGGGVVLDPNVQIVDAELTAARNYEGATLTLVRHAGADGQDIFSAKSGGTLSALLPGTFFRVEELTVGRVTTNAGGVLILTFTAGASQSLVNKAMQQIAYANTSDAPPTAVQIDWTFSDGNTGAQGTGGALTVVGHTTVQITPTNDYPVSNGALAPIAVQPHGALNYVIPATTFTDPDGDKLTFSISMTDTTGIPPWLHFDSATRTFSGTPGANDLGSIGLTIRAVDPSGASVTNYLQINIAEVNDAPTGSVTISGTPAQGQVLSAANSLADADGLGPISYQWSADGIRIANATASTLTLTEAQVGRPITVTATYTDGNGAVEAVSSAATSAVANLNDPGVASISGSPVQGRALSATASDIDGVGTLSYQWKADGNVIVGANASSFLLTPAQVGKAVSVTVSYTDGHGTAESLTSAASKIIIAADHAPTGAVTISGLATQGQLLTAANTIADVDGLGTIAYQWQADGAAIAGATAGTFTLTEAQVGKAITATASYTDGYGSAALVTSGATAAVANVNDAGSVSIRGVAATGRTLSATVADADGVGPVSYQWKADNANISGAIGSTLTLGEAQFGKLITVVASYTDGHGSVEALTSAGTSAVVKIPNTAPTFTVSDGKVYTDIGAADGGQSIAMQADGKIIVAGTSGSNIAVARYNVDGSLDASFDTDGKLTTAPGIYTSAVKVFVQADGKILVEGHSGGSLVLVRYDTNGALDTSFDGDGKRLTQDSENATISSVALQADGKLLAVGTKYQNGYDFALRRYDVNGNLDPSFDGDGKQTTDLGASDRGNSVAVQPDGKILVAGISGQNFALVRYNTNGSLDASFATGGIATTEIGAYDSGNKLMVQADGNILVAGIIEGNTFAVVRYTREGALDASFGTNGKLISTIGQGNTGQSVALQADGKIIIVAGNTLGASGVLMARYNADGSPDLSFDTDGKVLAGPANFVNITNVYDVMVQPDGKILLAGTSNIDFYLARFNPDGSVDTTFSPPANTLDGSPSFSEQNYGTPTAVVLDANAQIFDAQLAAAGSYAGATLTLARHDGASSQDVFSARVGGTLSKLIAGAYFSVDGVTIGTVTTNAGGTLTLAFSADASQTLVDKTLQQIAYANVDNAPPTTAQIDWTFNDGNTGVQGEGGALSVVGHTTVRITGLNDVPVATAIAAVTVAPNVALNYVIPTGTFVDPDGDALTYSVSMVNGTGVPSWLQFDAAAHTFSGTPANADIAALDLRVRVTDPSGAQASSVLHLTVAVPNAAPTGSVTINGAAKQGQTLSAVNTLADADGLGTIAYQWKAAGSNIAGATASSLTLGEAQIGKVITVTASYLDGHGTAEAVTSGATDAVINVNGGVASAPLVFNFVGVLLSNSPTFTVAPGFVTQLYDAEGSQTISVQAGASLALVGAMGANTVRLAGTAAAWHAFHDGSTAIFVNDNGSRVEIPANTVAQTMQFDDQSSNLMIDISGALPIVVLGTHALANWTY
ncbi:MAG: putative Ig domain-containing protein, partial [Pseudomonadota bacterium]|nr:putative Ig domain-containing protein [Pseudomonadota bacterium]